MRHLFSASTLVAALVPAMWLSAAPAVAQPVSTAQPGAQPAVQPDGRVGRRSSDGEPQVVLYTMGKGVRIWEKFGHAAICVEYPPGSPKSRCYNYGTTDFSQPVSVGWGFLRGQGEFWVAVTTPEQMIARYKSFDRTLWRQVLPLPLVKVRFIEQKLAINALPQNRYYQYHHFYDNCTTRIRDILDEATGGALHANTESIPGPSFREFSRHGFSQDTWLLVATDYLLGRGAEVRPDLWQAMFLPSYLRDMVAERLGAEPVVIYERQGPQLTEGESSGRTWLILLAVLLAAPIAVARWRGRFERTAIAFAATPLFLLSLAVWFLALVTVVKEFRYNEILLLYVPTDIALPFLRPLRRARYARWRLGMVLVASLLRGLGVFIQPLWAPALVVFLPMFCLAVPWRSAAASHAGHAEHQSQTSGSKSGQVKRTGNQRKKKR